MSDPAPLPLTGAGAVMRALAARAAELSRDVTRPVMLVGARGLGKQYLARKIHADSTLAASPLLVIDGRQDDTVQSQALSQALAGTGVLVRHVDALSIPSQRSLDARAADRRRNIRVMATTASDIVALVTAGRFLESLYYRLFAWPMVIPPLAERETADLVALGEAVLRQTADADGDLPVAVGPDAAALLAAHAWPDNLRELEAVLALAQLRARGEAVVQAAHLSLHGADNTVPPPEASIADIERWHMLRALAVHRGNRTHAARTLGVSRMTLITRLRLFHDEDDA